MKTFTDRLLHVPRLLVFTIIMLGGIIITLIEIMLTHYILVSILGKEEFGLRVKQMFAGAYCFMSGVCVEKILGIEIVFTGDQVPPQENVLLLSNHLSFWDQSSCIQLLRVVTASVQ